MYTKNAENNYFIIITMIIIFTGGNARVVTIVIKRRAMQTGIICCFGVLSCPFEEWQVGAFVN